MVVETHEDATLVPTAAIQRGAPGTFVFLVKEDKTVAVTPVQLGAVSGETSEVSKGLAPGNLVVVDGADKLRDGSSVELIDAAARATQQAAPPRENAPGAGKGANGQGRRSKGGG
jgi:multidrug efflux system membrane fusion protein